MASNERNDRRAAKKLIETQLAKHPCGSCSACCTVKAVAEIDKPEGVACPHLGRRSPTQEAPASGCSVYGTRPQGCRDYFCAYRYGLIGGEELRPDKLGLVFDVAEDPPKGLMMLAVREVRAGAIAASMEQLTAIAELGHVLYLIEGTGRRFMGPEERVKVCLAHARRHLPLHVPR